jgi:hypothetical protein
MKIPSLETGQRIMTIPRGIETSPSGTEATVNPTPRPRHTLKGLFAEIVSDEIIG